MTLSTADIHWNDNPDETKWEEVKTPFEVIEDMFFDDDGDLIIVSGENIAWSGDMGETWNVITKDT